MVVMGDPRRRHYERLGLTGNPFVAEATSGVAAHHFTDVGLRLPPAAPVVELVGCRGAGKTAHLRHWVDEADYHHVDVGWSDRRPPPAPRPGSTVAWDEADRLPRPLLVWWLRRARRRGARVLLGAHRPTGLADRTLALPPPTGPTVAEFAARRILSASTAAPELQLPGSDAERIAAASEGCWWQVGTMLHEWAGQVQRP